MTAHIPIRVRLYSGSADDCPESFYIEDKEIIIKDVTDRWYQGDRDPEHPVSNYFKVVADNGEEYIIKHELAHDTWYLFR